jgi:ammonia channel protein AmtB
MVLIGPIAGYIGGASAFDIVKPWEMMFIGFGGPIVVFAVYLLMRKIRIDERKIVPLTLGGGLYGAIITGIVGWGDKTGGFFGITEGEYAFQNAEINLWWQLAGIGVVGGSALITGLVLIIGMEKTIGLRVTEEQELAGLDSTYWKTPLPIDEVDRAPAPAGSTAAVMPTGR